MPTRRVKMLQKFGDSYGVIIPVEMLRALGIRYGDGVIVDLEDNGKISVAPLPLISRESTIKA